MRYLGIDIGAETVKVIELIRKDGGLYLGNRAIQEHHKGPHQTLLKMLESFDWLSVAGASVSGRLSRSVRLSRVPIKQAQSKAFRYLFGKGSSTIVSIGSHGFSVLELRESGVEVHRENSRCSQGTGNFLCQLVERFDLTIEKANELCVSVEKPAPLSGRCPVILKTDMTHLANKGEDRSKILAGLYDAVCENVQVLIKPRVSPPRVLLTGGVSRSERIQANFSKFCDDQEMEFIPYIGEDAVFFEAIGAALVATEELADLPNINDLIEVDEANHLDINPGPSQYLSQVKRMKDQEFLDITEGETRSISFGLDIGSTGSKAVAIDMNTGEMLWQGYVNTNGDPVQAAQNLVQQFVDHPIHRHPVIAFGTTGSGREIVGSLLSTCYGVDRVFILNEIAAHAEGALHYDSRVDTVFEIGGQDAKYIRLSQGRVIDAAMNEACSAGTGSFIEEQGSKFAGIEDVIQMGEEALKADECVSLGQHCSVFMAEIIDEAVATGAPNQNIIAGIYDSIIQNYLNRVKGSRSVGDVIFCQGMPFSSDALAASVARQTGSEVVIPPDPGTVGALGIALLTRKNVTLENLDSLDPQRFLTASVVQKDTYICKSKQGCGGAGNFCCIERLNTLVEDQKQRFTWGGGCSMWEKGENRKKLPDLAPDPFREREGLVDDILEGLRNKSGNGSKTIAITDEFQLKGLFPFFVTFLSELGFQLDVYRGADQQVLKRGIEEANVPFCAPMQLFHGLVSQMAEGDADFFFIPMVQELPRVKDEKYAVICPIVQGSPDVLRWDLGAEASARMLSPVIRYGAGGGLESEEFLNSIKALAEELGVFTSRWWPAYEKAYATQKNFDADTMVLGLRALEFCEEEAITPAVVLGRPYTIYNKVLNSNVPAILREQGTIAIPIDCYPVGDEAPIFEDLYWGYSQRNLRAVNQIRRTEGIYSLWCSNYSCGPDSFNLHFYGYEMEGKPFAVIETDGHSGDAGTKTRVEVFLHCVSEDLETQSLVKEPNSLKRLEYTTKGTAAILRDKDIVLFPHMGQDAEAVSACLRGVGIPAESLPMPERESLQLGRRHTSGKECIPMAITLGSLLERLERDKTENFAFFMPRTHGPCRFGVYNTLHKIVLERLGHSERIKIWSPDDKGYFAGIPGGLSFLIFIAFAASDMLLHGLYATRPMEETSGAAQEIHDRYFKELLVHLEAQGHGNLSLPMALLNVANGRLFGVQGILHRAAKEYAAVRQKKDMPTLAMVGEIYVRCDPFANDFVIEKFEERGIRILFAPFTEWLEYIDYLNVNKRGSGKFSEKFGSFVQKRVQSLTYKVIAKELGLSQRTTVVDTVKAANPYIREELHGEAVLTVGGPLYEWKEGHIDGVINVGPLECMPAKLSEAQFFHVAEQDGLPSLTLSLNGDPVDPEILDSFAFEIHSNFRKRKGELDMEGNIVENKDDIPTKARSFSQV